MKIKYQSQRFSAAYVTVIAQANVILAEYAAAGYDMTLRQLYYQFVARDLFPDTWRVKLPTGEMVKNHDHNYKRLGEAISKGRLTGQVDWDSIKDRSRSATFWHSDESVEAAIKAARRKYHLARWDTQPCRVEVWVEKDALASVMENTCYKYDVPVFACKGYVSQSAQWEAHQRHLWNMERNNQPTTILHFGDHDPSGLDMTRDIFDRMLTFNQRFGHPDLLTVERLALNINQVMDYNPPPAPAKGTDPRFAPYQAEFGDECWELDALNPTQLGDLVTGALDSIIDQEAWQEVEELEVNHKADFDRAIEAIRVKPDVETLLTFRQWKARELGKKAARKKKP